MNRNDHPSPPHYPRSSTSRLASLGHACRGLAVLIKQPNARIHLVATGTVIASGMALSISLVEWALLCLACAMVLTAEALNTALEQAVNLASPQWSEGARNAKDVAAAAVLLASIGAACVGAVVFLPHLEQWFLRT